MHENSEKNSSLDIYATAEILNFSLHTSTHSALCVVVVLVADLVQVAEIVRVKQIFESFDTDMSGSVLLKEFMNCAAWRQTFPAVRLGVLVH